MLELLKSKDYVLMIDECLDVLSPYKISKDDVKIIFNENLVSLDDDGFLIWNEEEIHMMEYIIILRGCVVLSH